MADALSRQGFLLLLQNEVTGAQSCCEEAVRLAREDANRGAIAWRCLDLALLRLIQRNYAAARAASFESIGLRDDTDEAQARVALGLEVLASIAAETGHPIRALHLFGASSTLDATRGTRFFLFERMLRERWLPVATNAVDPEAPAAAMTEGELLAPERAVAYALQDEIA